MQRPRSAAGTTVVVGAAKPARPPMMLVGVPTSELGANASEYEIRASTPDADTMQTLRVLWLVLFAMSAIITSSVVVAVLCSQKCRAISFNILVVALIFSDCLANLGFVVVLARNVATDDDTGMSTWECEWFSFWSVFGIAGSCWFNAAIAHEIHSLLSVTKQLRHYTPPTRRAQVLRCLGFYLCIIFTSTWQLWGVLPHRTVMKRGLTCSPGGTSPESAMFYNLAFVPFAGAIPVAYVVGLGVHSWWKGFLNFELRRKFVTLSFSADGRGNIEAMRQRIHQARSITIFFARIFLSLVFWLPSVLLTGSNSFSVVPLAIGMAWGPLQNILAALMCLSKPDLREAVLGLVTCWVHRRMVAPCTDADTTAKGSQDVATMVVAAAELEAEFETDSAVEVATVAQAEEEAQAATEAAASAAAAAAESG